MSGNVSLDGIALDNRNSRLAPDSDHVPRTGHSGYYGQQQQTGTGNDNSQVRGYGAASGFATNQNANRQQGESPAATYSGEFPGPASAEVAQNMREEKDRNDANTSAAQRQPAPVRGSSQSYNRQSGGYTQRADRPSQQNTKPRRSPNSWSVGRPGDAPLKNQQHVAANKGRSSLEYSGRYSVQRHPPMNANAQRASNLAPALEGVDDGPEEKRHCCGSLMGNCAPSLKTPSMVNIGEAVQMVHHLTVSEHQKHLIMTVWVQKLRNYQHSLEKYHFWRFWLRISLYFSAVMILILNGLACGEAYGTDVTNRTALGFGLFFSGWLLLTVGLGNYMNVDEKIRNHYSTRAVLTKMGMDFLTMTGEFKDCENHAAGCTKFVSLCNEITFHDTHSFVLVTSRRQGLPSEIGRAEVGRAMPSQRVSAPAIMSQRGSQASYAQRQQQQRQTQL